MLMVGGRRSVQWKKYYDIQAPSAGFPCTSMYIICKVNCMIAVDIDQKLSSWCRLHSQVSTSEFNVPSSLDLPVTVSLAGPSPAEVVAEICTEIA